MLNLNGNYDSCIKMKREGEFCWHSDVCESMSCNWNFKCEAGRGLRSELCCQADACVGGFMHCLVRIDFL